MSGRRSSTAGTRALRACVVIALAALPLAGGGAATTHAAMVSRMAVAGGIEYPLDNGLWYIGGCEPTMWTMDLDGVAASADTFNDESVGEVAITASGSDACGDIHGEAGSTSLSVTPVAGVGVLSCPSMSGTYAFADFVFTLTVSGTCSLNGQQETATLMLSMAGVPTRIGGDGGSFLDFALAGTLSAG